MSNRFGKAIKARRQELGITQERLGHETGLDRTYISGIERGVRNPSLNNMQKIARALKIKLKDLL